MAVWLSSERNRGNRCVVSRTCAVVVRRLLYNAICTLLRYTCYFVLMRVSNPYRPGFNQSPAVLAGRGEITDAITEAFQVAALDG